MSDVNNEADKKTDSASGVGVQRVVSVRSKAGRCSSGAERDQGTVRHAVLDDSFPSWTKALCGTAPGSRGQGWKIPTCAEVTCGKCLSRMNAH